MDRTYIKGRAARAGALLKSERCGVPRSEGRVRSVSPFLLGSLSSPLSRFVRVSFRPGETETEMEMEMECAWKILEFYSGIGGMRYSLARAGIPYTVVEAFDINDTANHVYHHNFGHRPFQGNIQSLTEKDLDKYGAHAWLLCPPCQPYTRQGLRKHSADARASSFMKILHLIPHMLHPPQLLFVENVVGFETSDTHDEMIDILNKLGFVTQEYILSPLQFRIPYSRPRYFCLAKRLPLSFREPTHNNQLLQTPPIFVIDKTVLMDGYSRFNQRQDDVGIPCEPIRNFLEPQLLYSDQVDIHEFNVSASDSEDNVNYIPRKSCAPRDTSITQFINDEIGEEVEGTGADKNALKMYIVPLSLIDRWGSAMDIVYPDSTRCCCFTKSYYRYVKGTGSFLATSEGTTCQSAKIPEVSFLKELGLRYFTPREVANLHCFPEDFHFPHNISLKQQYALLGNSLSVAVVAPLLQYLFAEPT